MPTLCPPRETKRNETEMGEIDIEAPFRFIRFFLVLSATLTTVRSSCTSGTE
jgi:hypothetical protein